MHSRSSPANPHACCLILCMAGQRSHTCAYCMHTQDGLLCGKSTYEPVIWSLKVFGLIFNLAGERVCQLPDCLTHIIPLFCILMNVHQAKRCVHVYVAAVQRVCEHFYVRGCVRACLIAGVHVIPCLWTHITAFAGNALNLHYVWLRGTKTICNFTR